MVWKGTLNEEKGVKLEMIQNDFSVEGKVAIVTGAGRGIGKAIVLILAEAGADITWLPVPKSI